MNAAAAVRLAQENIINSLSEMEGLVAQLYKRFADIIPEHKDFWLEIAEEEETHSRLLNTMHKILEKGDVFYNIGYFDQEMTSTIIELLKQTLSLANEKPVSQLQALTTALQIEAMAVESEFYTIVTSDAPEFEIITDRLVQDTHRHSYSLNAAWQNEVLKIPRQDFDETSKKEINSLLKKASKGPEISIHYNSYIGSIVGEFTGTMDIVSAKHYIERVVHAGGEYYCKRFLNDIRGAVTNFSDPVLNDILGIFDSIGMDRSWIRAILVSDDSRHYYKLEKLARKSGYTVKLFTEYDEAVNWLVTMR